jgi:hypothetical protein
MTKVLTEDGFLFGQNSAAECDSRSRPEAGKQENGISRSMVQHFKNNLTILRFPGEQTENYRASGVYFQAKT